MIFNIRVDKIIVCVLFSVFISQSINAMKQPLTFLYPYGIRIEYKQNVYSVTNGSSFLITVKNNLTPIEESIENTSRFLSESLSQPNLQESITDDFEQDLKEFFVTKDQDIFDQININPPNKPNTPHPSDTISIRLQENDFTLSLNKKIISIDGHWAFLFNQNDGLLIDCKRILQKTKINRQQRFTFDANEIILKAAFSEGDQYLLIITEKQENDMRQKSFGERVLNVKIIELKTQLIIYSHNYNYEFQSTQPLKYIALSCNLKAAAAISDDGILRYFDLITHKQIISRLE